MGRILRNLSGLLFALISLSALAQEPLLTIKVAGCCDGKDSIALTRADFDALPQHELTTRTPWTEGEHVYRGVLLRDLVKHFNIRGDEVKAVALNDYWAALPLVDGEQFDVLLASRQDGKELTLRNKGPLWVIYPLSQHPELDKEIYHSRMVWQLSAIAGK